MRRIKKPVFFVVFISILIFSVLTTIGIHHQYGDTKHTYIKGMNDIRWGIDIRGGVDVTFNPPAGYNASKEQLDAAKSVIEQRLVSLAITDSELYVDYNNDRIILRFPWKSDETDFNPEQAVKEIGETALLTFREGAEVDSAGLPSGITKTNVILEGKDIEKAYWSMRSDTKEYQVNLKFTKEGTEKFSQATAKLYPTRGQISIWMDETKISEPAVQAQISTGEAVIEGNKAKPFTADEVKALADKINSGSLPFKLETSSLNVISPTQGLGARDAMAISGLIAFILVAIFMMVTYKLTGVVSVIALIGQIFGSLAAVSGFFGFMPSFTLTLPGIAGIILSIGMGVDANVITNERIKEELRKGKSLDGSIGLGFERGFSAIFDGNITVIIVAIVLMGAFGPPDSAFAKLLYFVFFMFGPTTTGAIYSFGYTLIVGVVCNFVFGVTASRLMISSISKFKAFRNPRLYGGAKNNENL